MRYVVDCRHNASCDPRPKIADSLDEALDMIQNYIKKYDFEIVNGKLYDEDNDIGTPKEDGFTIFSDVVWEDGRVAGFIHDDGEGPVASIHEG